MANILVTSQAAAKQMIKFGNGGSIALIASMSAHAANRVSARGVGVEKMLIEGVGPDLSGV